MHRQARRGRHARHVTVFGGRALPGAVEGRGLRGDAARLDDLEEATVRDDGQAVGLEDGQERLVELGDGDLLGRIEAGFDLAESGDRLVWENSLASTCRARPC